MKAVGKDLVTVDLLVLLLVTPSYILGKDAYLSVVSLLLYLSLSLWMPLRENPQENGRKQRYGFIFRYALLLIIVTEAVVMPTVIRVIERAVTPIEADGYSPSYRSISDSAIHTEAALAFLDTGKNPYVERYDNTPLRFFQWLGMKEFEWEDPALRYFVYLPGTLFLSYPFYKTAVSTHILYDQRLIYLAIYVILLFVLPHLVKSTPYKLALVAAVGLNPLFTQPITVGMNDVAPFLGITIAILFLKKKRVLWAAVFMGIACALKQYAWFVVPFYLFYLFESSEQQKVRNVILSMAIIGGILLVVCLPFLIWDAQAFYTDTFAFPAGRAELLYPVRGFTIGRLLMGAGIIPTFVSPFPFQLLQIGIGLPVFVILLWFQRGRGISAMILAAAVFTFLFGYFSRFFHHNYVGVVIALATLSIMMNFAQTTEDLYVFSETTVGKMADTQTDKNLDCE